MEEATDGMQDFASSVTLPLGSFINSLNASTAEVELLLSSASEWIGELESGTRLRLEAFDSTHRQWNRVGLQRTREGGGGCRAASTRGRDVACHPACAVLFLATAVATKGASIMYH